MPSISLQQDIVYGPVLSRRLGRSFGINLLSKEYKICSFDCVYCEYGKTIKQTMSPVPDDLPDVPEILRAVEKSLRKPHSMDRLTFSGNGEPTLYPYFLEVVSGVKKLRDELRPNVKLAVLSNSSRVMDDEIIEALSLLDAPMMKLDAGDMVTFKKLNRPVNSLKFEDILEGLSSVKNLIIQTILIKGEVSNIKRYAFEQLATTLSNLNPKEVHLYSVERPTEKEWVVALSPQELQCIKEDLQYRFGLAVKAFWRE